MNLIKFLDTMINLNPDIRLLMSNTAITPYRSTLVNTLLSTIRKNYDRYRNYSEMEIAHDMEDIIKSGKPPEDKEQEKFFEEFGKERKITDYRIRESNNSYKVFPALKYVLKLREEEEKKEDLDIKYVLKWYEGNPDNGQRAINHALGVMLNTIITETEPSLVACRNIPEVKDYMKDIKNKALSLSRKAKKTESKDKEDK